MRAIATDLDGTLLDARQQVSPRALAAMQRAREAGVEVIAATGRSRFTAIPRLGACVELVRLVCDNGACVVDPRSGELLAVWPLERELLEAVVARVETDVGDVSWGWEGPDALGRDEHFPVGGLDGLSQSEPCAGGILGADLPWAMKLMVASRELTPDGLWRELLPRLPASVTATISGGPFVELTAEGVSKAHGVAWVCDQLGINAGEVTALGDHANDIELLRWAGTGLAMASSHPQLVEVADRVIGCHDADGWAIEVERLLDGVLTLD